MNRVTAAIEKYRLALAERLQSGKLSQEEVAKLHKTLDMDLEEFAMFQNLKSLASMNGTLTLEEAQTVYTYLGETPDHFNRQPIEVKSVLTQLYRELLGRKLGR